MNKILSAALAAALAASPASASTEVKDIRKTIEGIVNPSLEVLKDKSLTVDQRKKKVVDIVSPVFDFPLIAKLTLGRKHWPKLTKEQQKEFTDLFVKSIRDSYADKMDLLTDETIDFQDPKPTEKGKYAMLTYVNSKGDRHEMLYRVYKQGNNWKVYDVEIAGISLVRSYGNQYDQFLQNASVEELMQKLKQRALGPPVELKSKETKPQSEPPKK